MIKKRTHIGDQEGLKLADDDNPICQNEAEWRFNEMRRCHDDIDYFVEHYYTIIGQSGDREIIKMYPKQRDLLHKIVSNNRIISLAARQSGKSETYSMFCVHQILFQKNYRILIAGNKGEIANEILAKIKDAYELVPNWMKPSIKTWNESKIVFTNGVIIKSTTTSKQAARGNTCDVTILDEFSFVLPSIQRDFYKAITPALSSRKNSKLIVVSTPNGVGDVYHEIWKDATTNPNTIWVASKIDWWDRPDRDEAWHQRELLTLGSEEAFQQEYGNSFLVKSGDKLVSDDKIIKLKESAENSDAVVSILPVNPSNPDDKLTFTRYFQYEPDHTYVMSVDSAEGTGQDSSVIYILDITHTNNIKLAAKFDSSKVIPEEFAMVIYRLWMKYGKPKIMIETNACGLAVVEALKNLSRTQNDKIRFELNSIVNYNRPAGHTGINSNNQSKSKAMLNLQNFIQSNRYGFVLADDELYRELPFCEKRSGSGNVTYKALKGHHDDHILALVWGLFILSQELIEKHFTVEYGIDEDTKQKYPTLVLPMGEDVETYKDNHRDASEMGVEEAMELAAKWRMLGDEARASFILQSIWERETEDTGGVWGRNPYQIDQSLYSDSFRKKFFSGKYSDNYFKPPISDPNDDIYENDYGFGWMM